MEQLIRENCVASTMVPEQEMAEVQHRLDQYLTLLIDCGTGRWTR